MILLASVGGFHVGNIIISLILFLFFIALIVGIVIFIVKNSRNKRLDEIETKIDRLLSDKDK